MHVCLLVWKSLVPTALRLLFIASAVAAIGGASCSKAVPLLPPNGVRRSLLKANRENVQGQIFHYFVGNLFCWCITEAVRTCS